MIKVVSVEHSESPNKSGTVRATCHFVLGNGEPRSLWIDYPAECSQFIDQSGNPWAILLLPVAVELQESLITIDLAVDIELLENLYAVHNVWSSWFDWVKPVEIKALTTGPDETFCNRSENYNTGLFFSGGVDSCFSFIRHSFPRGGKPTPLSLITIHGFDIPLSNADEFEKVVQLAHNVASMAAANVIPMVTNLRSIEGYQAENWGPLGHGAALAAMGHLLSGKFGKLIIGSSYTYKDLHPWGSHPLTDPLFSSTNLGVIHEGAAYTRVDKTKSVVENKEVANKLRVCHKDQGSTNCSNCPKCLRTMLTIDLLGGTDSVKSFDWENYHLDKVKYLYLDRETDNYFFLEISDAARGIGREDIVNVVEFCIKKSKKLRRIQKLHNWLSEAPLLWRLARPIRKIFPAIKRNSQ